VTRVLAWFAGLVGIAALGRWLARRSHGAAPHRQEEPVAAAPATDADPAEELRRKLAETREVAPETAPSPPAEPEALEERRARVHAKAREAIDAMADDGQVPS
jgi:hypothetical protein